MERQQSRILVSYIPTSGGKDALNLALTLARAYHAQVELAIVKPGSSTNVEVIRTESGYEPILDSQIKEWLGEATADIPDDIPVSTSILYGEDIAKTLLSKAKAVRATAMTTGSHGGGLFKALSFGKVVDTILGGQLLPVAIAPQGYTPTAITGATVITPDDGYVSPGLMDHLDRADAHGVAYTLIHGKGNYPNIAEAQNLSTQEGGLIVVQAPHLTRLSALGFRKNLVALTRAHDQPVIIFPADC